MGMALLVSGGVRLADGCDPEDFDGPHISWFVPVEEIFNVLAMRNQKIGPRCGFGGGRRLVDEPEVIPRGWTYAQSGIDSSPLEPF